MTWTTSHRHNSEAARLACWACSDPDKLKVTPEDEAEAARLVAEGWKSTSNKYRTVAKTAFPPFELVVRVDPIVPAWLRRRLFDAYRSWTQPAFAESSVTSKTLSMGVFRAFKKLTSPWVTGGEKGESE